MKTGSIYRASHMLIWGTLLYYTATMIIIIFECHPVKETWNPITEGHCVNRTLILIVSAAVNVFSDFLILLLPVWAIWHLQMALKRKIGVIAIFATGILYEFTKCLLDKTLISFESTLTGSLI